MENVGIKRLRFENYRWGSSIDIIRNKVLVKGHELIDDGGKSSIVEYVDMILDKEVIVKLYFGLELQKLYMIYLRWHDASIYETLYEILVSKYGESKLLDVESSRYRWEYNRHSLEIYFNYFNSRGIGSKEVWLYYRSDYYYFAHRRELAKIKYGEDVYRF